MKTEKIEKHLIPIFNDIFPIYTKFKDFVFKVKTEGIPCKISIVSDRIYLCVVIINFDEKGEIYDLWEVNFHLLNKKHCENFDRVKCYLKAWAMVISEIPLDRDLLWHFLPQRLASFDSRHPLDLKKPNNIEEFSQSLRLKSRLGNYFGMRSYQVIELIDKAYRYAGFKTEKGNDYIDISYDDGVVVRATFSIGTGEEYIRKTKED